MLKKNSSFNAYEILMAFVISARATSFIFSKMLLQTMDTFCLLSIRFLIAFALLSIMFIKRMAGITRHEIFSGIAIGALFFLVMTFELTALKTADSSLVSLLENSAIIIVPFLDALILRRPPRLKEVVCALIAMAGVALLSAGLRRITAGFWFGIMAAFTYACAIIITARLSHSEPAEQDTSGAESKQNTPHKQKDPLLIGIIQLGTMGFLSLIVSLATKSFTLPVSPLHWIQIAILVVVCTGFGFTLQPVAQSRISPERAGLYCALSPAIATILGVVVLHEQITLYSIAGICLILFSLILPYIGLKRH